MDPLDEDAVDAAVFRILSAAEKNNWQLDLMPPSMRFGDGWIQTPKVSLITDESDYQVTMEAWDRLVNEKRWVRQTSGIKWKVNEAGRKALQQHRNSTAGATPTDKLDVELQHLVVALTRAGNHDTIDDKLTCLETAAKKVSKSFSGSWIGYHSIVYYENFAVPPEGARFTPEWGLMLSKGAVAAMGGLSGSIGNWRRYDPDEVIQQIYDLADNPDLTDAHQLSKNALRDFNNAKGDMQSLFEIIERTSPASAVISGLRENMNALKVKSAKEFAEAFAPRSEFPCRDVEAISQGTQVPPHIAILGQLSFIRHTLDLCTKLATIAERFKSHLKRTCNSKIMTVTPSKVFIGHGRSSVWRDLKDFLHDRLKLEYEEFNSSAPAGKTTVERLTEMLDVSNFAFLVMTAEDETADGKLQARLNVIHEIGLFQGKLGFHKAIILLEEGCEEFSNIVGLSQIRFPKGNISAKFEEIRRVLEREGIISI